MATGKPVDTSRAPTAPPTSAPTFRRTPGFGGAPRSGTARRGGSSSGSSRKPGESPLFGSLSVSPAVMGGQGGRSMPPPDSGVRPLSSPRRVMTDIAANADVRLLEQTLFEVKKVIV